MYAFIIVLSVLLILFPTLVLACTQGTRKFPQISLKVQIAKSQSDIKNMKTWNQSRASHLINQKGDVFNFLDDSVFNSMDTRGRTCIFYLRKQLLS